MCYLEHTPRTSEEMRRPAGLVLMRCFRRWQLVTLAAVSAGVLLLATQACWSVAPDSALGLEDAASDATKKYGDGSSIVADGGIGADSADGAPGNASGDAADAFVEAAPTTQPFAMATIAAGVGFACRVDSTGLVWCWGDNTYGEMGSTPSSTPVTTPAQIPNITGAVAVALGDHHACALTTSQSVYCWGLNAEYQLGHPSASNGDQICPGSIAGQTVPCSPTPAQVTGIPSALAIAAAGSWTCILASGGSTECWGAVQSTPEPDGGVPCGTGTEGQGGNCYPAPYPVPGSAGVGALAVGNDHACTIVDAGAGVDAGNQVSCWGNNNEGQVSPSACPAYDCTTPITRSDLPTSTALAAGNSFTCALGADGIVRCFGDNSYGELGHEPGTGGDFGNAGGDGGLGIFNSTPSAATQLGTAASLIGGGKSESACAILAGGAVECWGNIGGTATSTPVTIAGLPAMLGLGTFDATMVCGQALDDTYWCFSLSASPSPAQIP